jgi:hypothetical protein
MIEHLRALLADPAAAAALARHGRQTVLARHTCAHRVDELLALDAALRAGAPPGALAAAGAGPAALRLAS